MKSIASVHKFFQGFIKSNPFLFLAGTLLLITSALKVSFYYYNHNLIFTSRGPSVFQLVKWSLTNDLFIVLLVNLPFLLFLMLTKRFHYEWMHLAIRIVFCAVNSFMLIMNIVDIFYYRFHFQRSNIDLFYSLDHPAGKLGYLGFILIASSVILISLVSIMVWQIQNLFYFSFIKRNRLRAKPFILAGGLAVVLSWKTDLKHKLIPTYPLVDLSSGELSIVQNSMHTLIYSLYRDNKSVLSKRYFPDSFCDSTLVVKKVFAPETGAPRNIVLFIMESIPADFFTPSGRFKVTMPFFDSLLHYSTYFSNAYSFGRHSNQGITSILSGIPTLTDIPLYHSSFTNLPKTAIGDVLKANGYSSFFCIGDTYDNFGFAKCTRWLGIENYYCDKDIPGYQNLPKAPMGIYDEYVLHFMHQKINTLSQPFLAINYNTTTHYPNKIPDTFKRTFPAEYSDAMKSMAYYDNCLRAFFNKSKGEDWFERTIFIFCADHWVSPDDFISTSNNMKEFKIPIIIYDPSVSKAMIESSLASQFDILGTILSAANYKDTAISFGNNLLDQSVGTKSKVVYNRLNNFLYQIIDSNYVLGFNIADGKTEYLYDHKKDKDLRNNIKDSVHYSDINRTLSDSIKIFFQKTAQQYFKVPDKD